MRDSCNLIKLSVTVLFCGAAKLFPMLLYTVSCDRKLNVRRITALVPPVHLLLYNRVKSRFKNIRPHTLVARPAFVELFPLLLGITETHRIPWRHFELFQTPVKAPEGLSIIFKDQWNHFGQWSSFKNLLNSFKIPWTHYKTTGILQAPLKPLQGSWILSKPLELLQWPFNDHKTT